MAAQPQDVISIDQFLAWLVGQEGRFELVNGQIQMMAGATNQHNDVVNNVTFALTPPARSSGCRPTSSDTGVQTGERGLRYPDVVVDCGPPNPDASPRYRLYRYRQTTAALPAIVVEVSSPGTRGSDIGVKLAEYQNVPAVQMIIQIEPDVVFVAVYRREPANGWQVEVYESLEESIDLPPLNAALALKDIYFGLEVKPRPKLQLVANETSFEP